MRAVHLAHQGVVKTKALIRSKIWFPSMNRIIEELIRSCVICQADGSKTQVAPLRPSEMPEGPWQDVSADFFGPMADGWYYFVNHDD
jgi:hypothetical protein